jgi:hypothetical protein
MKKTALPIAFLAALALSACGEKPAPATTAAPADAPAAADASKKPARAAKPGAPLAAPMPQGVALTFPYHFRSDRLQESKNGQTRRVIRVEALGADPRATRKAVREDLRTAGFRPMVAAKDLPKTEDGSVRQVFIKKGWKGNVTVVVAPLGERRPAHRSAGAAVTYIWYGEGIGGTPATTAEAPAAEPADATAATPEPAAE